MRPPPAVRIPELEGIRALAIILVVAVHFTGPLGVPNVTQGQLGVNSFLQLSGFLLAYRYRPEPPRAYLLRRFLALAPRYWLVIPVVLVVLDLAGLAGGISAGDVISHVLFVNAITDAHYRAIDVAWWFPSAIAVLYVSFLAVRPLVARGRWACVLLCGLLFETVAIVVQQRWGGDPATSAVWQEATPRIMDFYLGAAVGTFLLGQRKSQRDHPMAAVAAVAATLAGSFWCYDKSPGTAQTVMLGLGVTLLGLSLGAAAHQQDAPRLLTACVAWISSTSYEIYLLHDPLVQSLNARWLSGLGWPGSDRAHLVFGGILGIAIALVLADALHRLPLESLLRRRDRHAGEAPPA